VVTHQLQVERRTGKVRRPETDVLPLCHATTHGSNSVNSQPIFKMFSLSDYISSKFAAMYLLNIPPHPVCVAALPCETLTSENERRSQTNAVINDNLQSIVVTYLTCGGILNNQIKKGSLLSLPVKKDQ